VVLWRGGAPIGCYMHEFFKRCGIKPDHIAIRTSRYHGIDSASETIEVHNLGYFLERAKKDTNVLLVDDVHDTGLSIKAVKDRLKEEMGDNFPDNIRTATVYYKPSRNKTGEVPDYYVETTDEWLVFPHELEGLSLEEMDPQVAEMLQDVTPGPHKVIVRGYGGVKDTKKPQVSPLAANILSDIRRLLENNEGEEHESHQYG
jgi:hypoxanthine phosphoribosyltransferase